MNDTLPDFYMASTEDNRLNQLRRCHPIKRIHAKRRDDYLLIRISPPLDGHNYGTSGGQISELVIATRHKGVSLFPIIKWPIAVYVLRVLIENPEEHDVLTDEDLALIGWAEIYDSQLNIH